jgi:hypothetical protein
MKTVILFVSVFFTFCSNNTNTSQTQTPSAPLPLENKTVDTIPVSYTTAISEPIEATNTDSVVVIGKTAPRTRDEFPTFDNKVDSMEQLFGTWQLTEIFESNPEKEDNPPIESRYSKKRAYLFISQDSIVQNFLPDFCNQKNPIYRFGTIDKYSKYTSIYRYLYKANRKYLIIFSVDGCDSTFGSTFEVIDKNEILYRRQFVYRRVKN